MGMNAMAFNYFFAVFVFQVKWLFLMEDTVSSIKTWVFQFGMEQLQLGVIEDWALDEWIKMKLNQEKKYLIELTNNKKQCTKTGGLKIWTNNTKI